MIAAPLLAETACTLVLTGLIWTVQLVHYPLFRRVGRAEFAAFHREHGRRISWLVAPLMPLELLLAGAGLFGPGAAWARIAGFAAVAAIWLVTALVQVPQHGRLGRGDGPEAIRALVLGNWPRTLLWSFRAALLLYRLAIAG